MQSLLMVAKLGRVYRFIAMFFSSTVARLAACDAVHRRKLFCFEFISLALREPATHVLDARFALPCGHASTLFYFPLGRTS